MNKHEKHLLKRLLASGESRGKNRPLPRTKRQFVIEYGWWYGPAGLPRHVTRGKQNECFKNAFDLALENGGFTYVEGYAILDQGLETYHAWVTDGEGNAIDNTWVKPGVAYAGVPFLTAFANRSHLKNKAVICLIDDYGNDWPLLRELGDRPGEWLSGKGKGREKIVIPQRKRQAARSHIDKA